MAHKNVSSSSKTPQSRQTNDNQRRNQGRGINQVNHDKRQELVLNAI